jgi:glycosyltransferase involved in cell wall biosynthesis
MSSNEAPVLFLCPFLDMGGAERHWVTLLPALQVRGQSVRLIAVKRGGRSYDMLRDLGIPTRMLGARGGIASLASLPRLFEERKLRPRAIVTWGLDAHVLGAAVARRERIPQFVHWHRQPGFPMRPRERIGFRLVARSGASVIAVTQAQVPELASLGFAGGRTHVGLPGVPTPDADFVDRAAARAALGLPGDAFVAVLVARLRPEKRIDLFIEALDRLKQRGRNVHGVVVGDGPEEERLADLIARLDAPVDLVGYQAKPAGYVIAGDAVCLTSDLEALPLTLLEATACGRPIVVTDIGGVREVVKDGSTGFVVPPGDASAIADAMEKLAADPAMSEQFGDSARRLWQSKLSVDAMADNYFALLRGNG